MTVSRSIDYRAWGVVVVAVALVAFIYSGQATLAAVEMKKQLLSLIPALASVLTLLGIATFLLAWKLRHAPDGHFLSNLGRKWTWLSPIAIVAGVVAVPLAVQIDVTGTKEAAALTKSSIAQSAGTLPNCAAGPVTAPSKAP